MVAAEAFGAASIADYDPSMVIDLTSVNEAKPVDEPSARVHKSRWTGWQDVTFTRTSTKRSFDEANAFNEADECDEASQELADLHLTQTGPKVQGKQSGSSTENKNTEDAGTLEQLTPLSFWLPPDHEPGKYWTHEAYRNAAGEAVSVHYCKDRVSSENIAKQFLQCPVIGFDMEWAPFGAKGIKGNISVIQLACEDKIALLHISQYSGHTVSDLLCPSLRKIIENEKILKCGVAINNCDGNRLRQWMKLKPKGMFELSHLHRLVKWAKRDKTRVSKKLVKLTYLVEEHLGRPLFKGSVRTSNWTKPLNEDQIRYAAADAYCGFRLFHALETKRLALSSPIPPRPFPAELGLPLRLGDDDKDPDAEDIIDHEWQGHASRKGAKPQVSSAMTPLKSPAKGFKTPAIDYLALGDPVTRRAFSALRALRKRLSLQLKQSEDLLATDSTLFSLAEMRPRCLRDMDDRPTSRSFADLAIKHGHVDLVAFLKRHVSEVPNVVSDGEAKQSEPVQHVQQQPGLIQGPEALQTQGSHDAPHNPSNILGAKTNSDDYTKYFSEDDFDDTDFDSNHEQDDDHGTDDDDFEEITTSFGKPSSPKASMPKLRPLHTF